MIAQPDWAYSSRAEEVESVPVAQTPPPPTPGPRNPMARIVFCALLILAVVVLLAAAGQPPDKKDEKKTDKKDPQAAFEPKSKPGAGQKFLERFVGEWDVA